MPVPKKKRTTSPPDPSTSDPHLSTKSDYVKAGSGMLLMQLASGLTVG
jgi:hypothetical protein